MEQEQKTRGIKTVNDELFEEAETTMVNKFPPEEHGEDTELSVIYDIMRDLKDNANRNLSLIEKAFLAGRSKTSWETFQKENEISLTGTELTQLK